MQGGNVLSHLAMREDVKKRLPPLGLPQEVFGMKQKSIAVTPKLSSAIQKHLWRLHPRMYFKLPLLLWQSLTMLPKITLLSIVLPISREIPKF